MLTRTLAVSDSTPSSATIRNPPPFGPAVNKPSGDTEPPVARNVTASEEVSRCDAEMSVSDWAGPGGPLASARRMETSIPKCREGNSGSQDSGESGRKPNDPARCAGSLDDRYFPSVRP